MDRQMVDNVYVIGDRDYGRWTDDRLIDSYMTGGQTQMDTQIHRQVGRQMVSFPNPSRWSTLTEARVICICSPLRGQYLGAPGSDRTGQGPQGQGCGRSKFSVMAPALGRDGLQWDLCVSRSIFLTWHARPLAPRVHLQIYLVLSTSSGPNLSEDRYLGINWP